MFHFKNSIVERLNWPSQFQNNRNIDVKRDDLIHPIVSGNKWRKLHKTVDFIKREGLQTIATFGGAFSNHLLATAYVGHTYQLQTHGIVRGDEFPSLNSYLSLCKQYGMTLHFISRESYANKTAIDYPFLPGNTFIIPEGGRGKDGIEGCKTIVYELYKEYDYIALPVGTATTLEGICEALNELGLKTKVLAFSALKSNQEDQNRINKFGNRVLWFDELKFGGYGQYNHELIHFMNSFISETRLLIDPIYQGKMFFGLSQLLKQAYFKPTDQILCLHTGGNLGLYSKKAQKLLFP